MAPVSVSVPAAVFVTVPLPVMVPASVNAPGLATTSAALFVTEPVTDPLFPPPSPSCNVPALTVVLPL